MELFQRGVVVLEQGAEGEGAGVGGRLETHVVPAIAAGGCSDHGGEVVVGEVDNVLFVGAAKLDFFEMWHVFKAQGEVSAGRGTEGGDFEACDMTTCWPEPIPELGRGGVIVVIGGNIEDLECLEVDPPVCKRTLFVVTADEGELMPFCMVAALNVQ